MTRSTVAFGRLRLSEDERQPTESTTGGRVRERHRLRLRLVRMSLWLPYSIPSCACLTRFALPPCLTHPRLPEHRLPVVLDHGHEEGLRRRREEVVVPLVPVADRVDRARLVVSEPLGELAGAWNEVPESTFGVISRDGDMMAPFSPIPPA